MGINENSYVVSKPTYGTYGFTNIMFVNISKAFDSVNHDLLMRKC